MTLWLLTRRTTNGQYFYDIFATKELAVLFMKGIVDTSEWREDVSGDLSYTPEGDYHYFITQEPYTPENLCGGCQGLGSHQRHCRNNPNYSYKLMLADRAEDLADSIGSNNISASNYCYAAAGLLREGVG